MLWRPATIELILRSPGSPSDWDIYFDLRGRILRAPWGQPRGSERDSAEESAFPLAVACGRLHLNNPDEAQVRYSWPLMRMSAVVPTAAGFLRPWKPRRVDERPGKIVLNAREKVVQFYARHGYAMTGQAETLFGVIRHWRMEKVL